MQVKEDKQSNNISPSNLSVAAWCENTQMLGPGHRFALWLQGCPFSCPDCVAPAFIPSIGGYQLSAEKLAEAIISIPDIQGITISGGEPFLQAETLLLLLELLRDNTMLSIILYSGYRLQELRKMQDSRPAIKQVLAQLDVLIDGRYQPELNDSLGLRGSSNQQVYFLTPRYAQQKALFTQKPREIEVKSLMGQHKLMVGIPTWQQWRQVNLSEDNCWYDELTETI